MAEQLRKRVFTAYERYAEGFVLRSDPLYIASKALSDWDLLSKIDLSGKRVLNIGCSEPIDELWFAHRVGEWVAIDFSPKSIRMAKRILDTELSIELADRVKLCVADALKLPFNDEMFDVATAFSTIEHIPSKRDRLKVLREIARVVKRGGHVVVTIPNKLNFPNYLVDVRKVRAGKAVYGFAYFYTPWELKRELERCGLKPIEFSSETRTIRLFYKGLPRIFHAVWKRLGFFGWRVGYLCIKP